MKQCNRNAGTGAANRMSQCDCPPVYVKLVAIHVEFSIAGEDLCRERLVEFDEIEVREFEIVSFLHFSQGRNGTNTHHERIYTGRSNG